MFLISQCKLQLKMIQLMITRTLTYLQKTQSSSRLLEELKQSSGVAIMLTIGRTAFYEELMMGISALI